VADAGAFRFLLLFCREIERVTQKNICVPFVGRVAPHNRIKGFGKSNFLHGMKKAGLKRASKHNRQTRNRQLPRVVGMTEEWNDGKSAISDTPIVHHSSPEVSIWSSSASRYTESGSRRLGAEPCDWFAALR